MKPNRKSPALGNGTGTDHSNSIVSGGAPTNNIRFCKGSRPKNVNEARLLHFMQAETSLTEERRNGLWVDRRGNLQRLAGGGE